MVSRTKSVLDSFLVELVIQVVSFVDPIITTAVLT